jgi:hypothetical protein
MVCWLFIGSSCFAAAFALLGGQEVVNPFVLSLDMTPTQFMIMAQVVIFLLGWPLEWTEIIVIFMPIFLPLLAHFNVDPLFFGLLVALNLQTAFLSPPVAMAAFYLKGVSPPHVTLNQIFLGMMPFIIWQRVLLCFTRRRWGISLSISFFGSSLKATGEDFSRRSTSIRRTGFSQSRLAIIRLLPTRGCAHFPRRSFWLILNSSQSPSRKLG